MIHVPWVDCSSLLGFRRRKYFDYTFCLSIIHWTTYWITVRHYSRYLLHLIPYFHLLPYPDGKIRPCRLQERFSTINSSLRLLHVLGTSMDPLVKDPSPFLSCRRFWKCIYTWILQLLSSPFLLTYWNTSNRFVSTLCYSHKEGLLCGLTMH